MKVNITGFNYHEFVDEIQEELQIICQDGQQILTEIIGGNKIIKTDRNILKNILYNLISNAIKYSKDSGKVFVSVDESKNERIKIGVTDHGIGIPPEHLNRIFERFYRVELHLQRSWRAFQELYGLFSASAHRCTSQKIS